MDEKHQRMLEALAENLLRDVYYPVSLCAWIDRQAQIMKLVQFDTHFCMPRFAQLPEAAECWLISNHINGDMQPYYEDTANRIQAAQSVKSRKCRLFLFSEDEGIVEKSRNPR